ncbi:MAG: hypothetical protein ACE5RN_06995 [Nitrosopumilaceae archaeon]
MSSIKKIKDLQNKIIQIQIELDNINKDQKPMPELINTTNMLRSNEYLQKSNVAKSKLIAAYKEYANELENMISSISKIKGDISSLKSRLISRKKPKKKIKKKRVLKRKNQKRKTKLKSNRRKKRKSRRL